MAKTKLTRGSRKRFEVYITDLEGEAQDPDSCIVYLKKTGEYFYDSPLGPYTCTKKRTGAPRGYWAADVTLPDNMTLGDWLAHFVWTISGVEDTEDFEFVVRRKDRPWIHREVTEPGVEVVG